LTPLVIGANQHGNVCGPNGALPDPRIPRKQSGDIPGHQIGDQGKKLFLDQTLPLDSAEVLRQGEKLQGG